MRREDFYARKQILNNRIKTSSPYICLHISSTQRSLFDQAHMMDSHVCEKQVSSEWIMIFQVALSSPHSYQRSFRDIGSACSWKADCSTPTNSWHNHLSDFVNGVSERISSIHAEHRHRGWLRAKRKSRADITPFERTAYHLSDSVTMVVEW